MDSLPNDPVTLLLAMKETDTLVLFEEIVLFFLRRKLQAEAIPDFLNQLQQTSFVNVVSAVSGLYSSMSWFYSYVASWHNSQSLKLEMNNLLKACLKWKLHVNASSIFAKVFAYSLQFYLHNNGDASMSEDEEITMEWDGAKETFVVEEFREIVEEKFKPMVQHWLVELEVVDLFCTDAVMSVLDTEVDRFVVRTCGGEFEKRWIGKGNGELESWSRTQVLPWLKLLYNEDFNQADWKQKLHYILYGSYTKLRISEMLNIITDFPESMPALHDLKVCLQHTQQRPRLIESLKNDITSRVLHPGVSTQNIITVYIAAVKALRELDLSGVVMEMVLEPCTTYLTQRDDSVRMIMQGLLWDDGSNDLAAELAKNQEPDEATSWSDRVTENPEDWVPDPREADPNKSDKSTRTSDIVTLFIGMYGSKEKFIKEYQKLLSKRLLQMWYGDQNESTEIRNLELLKKRFGEEDMSKCSVMLKDIADSKRINTYVKEEYYAKESLEPDYDLRTMIVSSQFWPELPVQEMEIPKPILTSLGLFNKGYESLKASRSLKWLGGVGTVDLELELEDRTLEVRVNTLQAAIIQHFHEQESCSLSELSDSLKIPPTVLRKKMSFWIQQGVLKESEPDHYVTIEKRDASMTSEAGVCVTQTASSASVYDVTERLVSLCEEGDEEKENSDEERERREKTEQVFWNYVQGMLKNLVSLPLDRIHKMLQMFAMHDDDEQIELEELRQLLNNKVQRGLLVLEQGKYKLVRDPS